MKPLPADMFPGSRHLTRFSGYITILEYIDWDHVTVKFEGTGNVISCCASNIRSGRIGDALRISVCGVGFLGEGPYNMARNRIGYNHWSAMLSRVYSTTNPKTRRNYDGCYVDIEWHNFQNFAKWWYQQPYCTLSGYELDKDLKIEGNTKYGPDACLVIPKCLNSLLGVNLKANKIASGVHKPNKSNKYMSIIQVNGVRRVIRGFSTAEEASLNYQKRHRDEVISLARDLHSQKRITDEILLLVEKRFSND